MRDSGSLYPDFVLAEVAHKYFRKGTEQQVVLARLEKISEASDIASISVEAFEIC